MHSRRAIDSTAIAARLQWADGYLRNDLGLAPRHVLDGDRGCAKTKNENDSHSGTHQYVVCRDALHAHADLSYFCFCGSI